MLGLDGVLRGPVGGEPALPVVSWRYPEAARLEDPWNARDASGTQWAFGGTGATLPGDGGGFIAGSYRRAQLKVPGVLKDGSTYDTGIADYLLVRVALDRSPVRVMEVPIPSGLTDRCRESADTVSGNGVRVGSVWNGPGGELWALAACGEYTNEDGDKTFYRHWWLARWATATGAPTTVSLPDPPAGMPRALGARAFTMADGRMYVFTSSGLYRVSGLPRPFGQASVASVQRLKSGRVRVRVQCVGEPGQACFGRVVVRDARGKLVAMPYGTDAGTVAQLPIVTREFRPRRAVRGELSVTLTR